MDPEIAVAVFVLEKGVMSSYEVNLVNELRGPLNLKIAERSATFQDVVKGISKELEILIKCKRVEPSGIDASPEAHTVYYYIIRRIISLLEYTYRNFSIDADWFGHILPVLNNNALYLKEADLGFLLDVVSNLRNNDELWLKLVPIYASMLAFKDMLKILEEAVEPLKENVLMLWDVIIDNIKRYSPETIIPAYEAASRLTSGTVAAKIREQYFEWFIKNHPDIICIRELFENLKVLDPPSLKLYHLMIATEAHSRKPRIFLVRQLYREATEKFGSDCTQIWQSRIRFELATKNPTAAKKVMSQALSHVRPDYKDILHAVIPRIFADFKCAL